MKILVADTSSNVCIVGIFEDNRLIKDKMIDDGRTHSENFMPLVKNVLEESELSLDDIDYIAVVVGPGSFTGIRIGIASCKAMAEIKNIKLIPVISLESLAGNEVENSDIICSMIDAKNDQVYCGIFDAKINKKEDFMAEDINNALEKIKKYDNIIFVGDGAILHRVLIEDKLKMKTIKFSKNNKQCVSGLGIVAYKKMQNSEFLLSDEIMPIYLRKSQAERLKNGF